MTFINLFVKICSRFLVIYVLHFSFHEPTRADVNKWECRDRWRRKFKGRKRMNERVGGIDGASWSAGACTRRGARQASFCLFHDFKYFVTNILYYLGLTSQNY